MSASDFVIPDLSLNIDTVAADAKDTSARARSTTTALATTWIIDRRSDSVIPPEQDSGCRFKLLGELDQGLRGEGVLVHQILLYCPNTGNISCRRFTFSHAV